MSRTMSLEELFEEWAEATRKTRQQGFQVKSVRKWRMIAKQYSAMLEKPECVVFT